MGKVIRETGETHGSEGCGFDAVSGAAASVGVRAPDRPAQSFVASLTMRLARSESVAPMNFVRESNDFQVWHRPMLDGTLDVFRPVSVLREKLLPGVRAWQGAIPEGDARSLSQHDRRRWEIAVALFFALVSACQMGFGPDTRAAGLGAVRPG